MTAKSFCYACLGIFLLVAAWTMGVRQARLPRTSNDLIEEPPIENMSPVSMHGFIVVHLLCSAGTIQNSSRLGGNPCSPGYCLLS